MTADLVAYSFDHTFSSPTSLQRYQALSLSLYNLHFDIPFLEIPGFDPD